MLRLKFGIFLLLISITSISFAIEINVRIYTDIALKSIKITPLSGKYVIYNNDTKVLDLYKNNSVDVLITEGKIKLVKEGEIIGVYENLNFSAEGFLNTFNLKSIDPVIKDRVYDDGFQISVENSKFKIINVVELEHYVAGVVESEGGIKKNVEFLKLQAIISRTYAISNLRKHIKEEAFNLCDNVHCQLYRGRCTNSLIMMATSQTNGDIIIDQHNKPISAAFHSNCGGKTVNSEDVWSIETSYLKSVKDTFCLKQSHAKWIKKIPVNKWLEYLSANYNFPVTDSLMKKEALSYKQKTRQVYFDENPNIHLKKIRSDFKFNSTFFSLDQQGDTLIFNGNGYGHGVGLCQEGAMKMVDYGWTLKKIIQFYYKDVTIINITELKNQ